MTYDVAVVGGGVSGLAAAISLARDGARIILLEQAPRLGGRCYSFTDEKTGDVIDNGQHVLLGAYYHALEYLRLVGTRHCLRRQNVLRLPFHHPEKGFSTFEVSALPRPFHLTAGMLKFNLLSFNDRRKLLRVGLALSRWTGALEEQLSRLTVREWLCGLGQSKEAMENLWNPIAISVMNELPGRASALLFARSLKAAFLGKKSDSAILIPTIGQTELYVDGAKGLLKSHGARVLLNTGVWTLAVRDGRVDGVVLADGTVIHAGSVISAVPYHALPRLLPAKGKEDGMLAKVQRLPSSPIVSVHLWFDREFMDREYVGLIGKTTQWLFNKNRIAPTPGRTRSYLSAVISGAYDIVALPKEKIIARIVKDIHDVYPESCRAHLDHAVVIKEKRATFAPTNEAESLRPPTVTSLMGLYLAGDWTRTGLPATIEGAVKSGFDAAACIRSSTLG